MSVKVTVPNTSSDSLTFGSANTPTAAQVVGIDSGSSNGQLALYTTTSGTSTERVRIDSSGNVGIGTSSPVMDGNGSLYVSAINSNGGTFNAGGSQSGTANFVGSVQFVNTVLGTTDKRIASIAGITNGATNSGALTFNTWSSGSGAERMRIDSSGNLLVGTTSSSSPSSGFSLQPASGGSTLHIGHANGTPSTYSYMGFFYNGGAIGSITQNGTTAVAYNTSSDYRLKENIAPMTGALATVSALKPVTYTWKADGSDGQGFIAHELQAVVPDCVTGEKDAVELVDIKDEEGNVIGQEERPVYQGIDTSFLVATLTAAIQEQQAIITDLKARIETLEAK